MNKNLIKKYADNITKEDILKFGESEGININNTELNVIYNVIKNKQDEILNGDFYKIIDNYKNDFNPILFNKIIEKYEKYKKFID
jgi:hypothetical protein